MDNDNDFTFCQVGANDNQNDLEEKRLALDIKGITIGDKVSTESSSSRNSNSLLKEKVPSDAMTKEETVGSLSFNVIDKSSLKQTSGQLESEGGGNSAKSVEKKKTTVSKPAPRAKVPFEKGYSQMDWLKLTRTHPDLAGLKGQSNRRLISMKEVKQHQSEGYMWTVLKGRVYNISPYMKFHPGGVDMLMKTVGKDCTALFNKYHAWVNAEFLLEKCLVGILDDSQ